MNGTFNKIFSIYVIVNSTTKILKVYKHFFCCGYIFFRPQEIWVRKSYNSLMPFRKKNTAYKSKKCPCHILSGHKSVNIKFTKNFKSYLNFRNYKYDQKYKCTGNLLKMRSSKNVVYHQSREAVDSFCPYTLGSWILKPNLLLWYCRT